MRTGKASLGRGAEQIFGVKISSQDIYMLLWFVVLFLKMNVGKNLRRC